MIPCKFMASSAVPAPTYNCCISHAVITPRSRSLVERVSSIANKAIQDISNWLYYKGWVITSFLTASLLGEPLESIKSGLRMIVKWQKALAHYGIIDASNITELEKLDFKGKFPVLLLHGVHSSPHTFIPWAPHLQEAASRNEIGPIVTLQLEDDLEKRMDTLYITINKICEFQKKKGILNPKVDLSVIL